MIRQQAHLVRFMERIPPLSLRVASSARTLLFAGSETADSSRDNTALRNDKLKRHIGVQEDA